MTPIEIDLRDITNAMVEFARPHLGECYYSAPCIIGTLIPRDLRENFDNINGELGDIEMIEKPSIDQLIDIGLIVVPDGQRRLATKLQTAFDNDPERFDDVLAEVRKELAA